MIDSPFEGLVECNVFARVGPFRAVCCCGDLTTKTALSMISFCSSSSVSGSESRGWSIRSFLNRSPAYFFERLRQSVHLSPLSLLVCTNTALFGDTNAFASDGFKASFHTHVDGLLSFSEPVDVYCRLRLWPVVFRRSQCCWCYGLPYAISVSRPLTTLQIAGHCSLHSNPNRGSRLASPASALRFEIQKLFKRTSSSVRWI